MALAVGYVQMLNGDIWPYANYFHNITGSNGALTITLLISCRCTPLLSQEFSLL